MKKEIIKFTHSYLTKTMKKNLFKLSGLVLAICISASSIAQTSGSLTFNFTTIAHSGYSGTKNALAV